MGHIHGAANLRTVLIKASPLGRAVDLSAALLFLSFFLPWFEFLQERITGLKLALLGYYATTAWLIPSSALAVFLLKNFYSVRIGACVGTLTGAALLFGIVAVSVKAELLLSHSLCAGGLLLAVSCTSLLISSLTLLKRLRQ